MKHLITAALIAFSPIAFSAGNSLNENENLITQFGPDFSDYDMYQPYTMDEHNTFTQVWRSKERGFSDHYAITIVGAEGQSLDSFKEIQDKSVQRICLSNQATPVEQMMINGYPALTWTNTCQQEKLTITSIELAIMGNERFYHLRKLWKIPVTEDKVTEWQTLLSKTSICDITDAKHACPE